MKKTNFTKIPQEWCLRTNWLKGLIPLMAFFVFALPMHVQAQAPNCSNFSPSINADGAILVGADDFVTNHEGVGYPITVNVVNQWGGSLTTFVLGDPDTTVLWNVCSYLGKALSYSVTNTTGTCNLGVINLNGTPAAVLTSAFGTKITGGNVDTGKINVYCGYVPLPATHIPTAVAPCGGRVSAPKVQPDWIMPIHCSEESDTAEIIFRTWEVFDKDGNLTNLTDTIVVFRLPRLTPAAFVGSPEDSFYCEIEAVPQEGEGLKRYASWKQPIGLHDYELPYSKLRGVTYEIPATIIIAGITNAASQGPNVLADYMESVILKRTDGTVVTIEDIVSGDYLTALLANATDEQLLYGFLQLLIELNEKPINIILEATVLEFFPYLLLQEGDLILSEGGNFEQVDADWFYNGNGNSPYWFAGGWPSIYGSGDCINYCDTGAGTEFGCIEIQVPFLTIADGIVSDSCDTICLKLGAHCGITIDQDAIADWTGSCPQTRGVDSWITQVCWAASPNACIVEEIECGVPYVADETSVVVDYTCSEKAVKVHISQWQTLYDTVGPIFDFCYPVGVEFAGGELPQFGPTSALFFGEEECFVSNEWNHDEILDSIRAGGVYPNARAYEQCNPTVYTTSSHDCSAEVYVPSVTVVDNCSGVHSIKAMVNVQGGQRAVALELTNTEVVVTGVDTCVYYTYSHTSDPIRIPFTGCDGELVEVRYEAADNCWNQSGWYKYLRVEDATPPTIIADRAVNVTLNSKTEWVPAETFDEGSWDNCAVDLRLARRSDWLTDTACVDICAKLGPNAPYNNWIDILDDLGVARSQAAAAVAGSHVGSIAFAEGFNVNDIQTFLNEGEVEEYYFNQIVWLWEDDELCGPKVVHGWIYALAAYIAENCSVVDDHGNGLKVKDLEAIFDNLFAQPGYGNEIALLGGGWSQAVPFKCEDACEEVSAELLVMDYCCNWGTGWSSVFVEDKGNARLVKRLPDLNISCEAYNIFYKDDVEAAAQYGEGGSVADTANAFDALDEAFGSYIKTWVDNQNRPTDIDGNLLPEESLSFNYWNVTCEEKSETEKIGVERHDGTIDWIEKVSTTTFLDSAQLEALNGIIGINCYASCEQDVWVDLDECGQGTITRRFFITGGCGDKATSWEVEQVINVQSACGMRESMFDLPVANLGSQEEPLCIPEALNKDNLPDTIGDVVLKSHLVGKICNSPAVAVTVKEHNVLGQEGMKKYLIEWEVLDWCAPHTSSNRSFTYTQEVIATINPDCVISSPEDTTGNGDSNLVQGRITTEEGDPVQRVEMKAVLGTGSPLTTVTSGEGMYSFSINEGSQVSLVPAKNTGYANGVSTQDLIDIQRHVLQKNELGSKYKKIAADVNGNGAIDGLDVLELRKLVMKPDSKLPNNSSWRFFDTKTDMEVYDVSNVSGDMTIDFVGVKIGDVNLSGDPARSSRSTTGELHLNVADKTLKAGELYRVDVTSDNFVNINGMQYTLSYLTNLVEVENIEAGALNITKNNYMHYAPGVITSSWSEADGQSLSSDAVLFTIVLKAKSEVQLRDAFSLNNRVTTTEAYDAKGGLKDVSLRFDGQDSGFALYQNTPNPYTGQTVIGFKLPEASKATLSVYDVTGKVLKVVEGEYNQGYNEVKLKSSDLNATGVLYYQLDTKTYTATKKMIVIE